MRDWILIALMVSLSFSTVVSAEEENDAFSDAGLTLVALRNDSLDSNQDGTFDAIRVVLVINSSADWTILTLTLIGEYSGLTVTEEQTLSFSSQENASITYDSWATGQHRLNLEISDAQGILLKSINIGLFDLAPALRTPKIDLSLDGSEIMQTGDECEIRRIFWDETGPRWGQDGTRSISGTPFTVLDSDVYLDCSDWPAGEYLITETYRNGLGQTATDTLNLFIANRPPPQFSLDINGQSQEAQTPCSVVMVSDLGADYTIFTKEWSVTPPVSMLANSSTINCDDWAPGVYKVLLTVTNAEGIHSTGGEMLVRLPSDTPNQSVESPIQSERSETQTNSFGIYGIATLSIVLGLFVFVIMLKSPEDDELEIGDLSMLDESGQPDAQGLSTHTDDGGVLWRRHPDGEVDWWDHKSNSWQRW